MFDEIERRAAEQARHRENHGRLASVHASFTTTGQGTVQFEKRINFGLTYIHRPYMAYGTLIDPEAIQDALGLGPNDPVSFPQATGYVCEWDIDDRDRYVGAWCGVAVVLPVGMDPLAPIELTHQFTFLATALKNVPLPPSMD